MVLEEFGQGERAQTVGFWGTRTIFLSACRESPRGVMRVVFVFGLGHLGAQKNLNHEP